MLVWEQVEWPEQVVEPQVVPLLWVATVWAAALVG